MLLVCTRGTSPRSFEEGINGDFTLLAYRFHQFWTMAEQIDLRYCSYFIYHAFFIRSCCFSQQQRTSRIPVALLSTFSVPMMSSLFPYLYQTVGVDLISSNSSRHNSCCFSQQQRTSRIPVALLSTFSVPMMSSLFPYLYQTVGVDLISSNSSRHNLLSS
jgi:hypothetical protein